MNAPPRTRALARALGVALLALACLATSFVDAPARADGVRFAPLHLRPAIDIDVAFVQSPAPLLIPPATAQGVETASPQELDCLAQAVYYEARGESVEGQAAVAQVVLNRSHLASFPGTVCGVVYQGRQSGSCQFSFVCNGAMRRPREPGAWARARSIAGRALGGYVMQTIGAATEFHAAGSRPAGGGSGLVRLGRQVFYCAGGPRARRAVVALALGARPRNPIDPARVATPWRLPAGRSQG